MHVHACEGDYLYKICGTSVYQRRRMLFEGTETWSRSGYVSIKLITAPLGSYHYLHSYNAL